MEEEKEKLEDASPYTVLDYIRTSFEIILDIKKEEGKEQPSQTLNSSKYPPQDYELMLQKLEEEIRGHIRVEQQLKILVETSQSEMEDCEKEITTLKTKLKQTMAELQMFKEKSRTKESEITQLKETIIGKERQIESMVEKGHNKSTYDDIVTIENNLHNKSMMDQRQNDLPTRNNNLQEGKAICKTHKGSVDFHKGVRTISHERNRTKLSNDYQKYDYQQNL